MRKIPCHKCEGTGVLPLPDPLDETLSEIKGPTTTEKLFRKFPGVTRNAQNNRLEELRALGFLKRERQGKEFIYTKTSK